MHSKTQSFPVAFLKNSHNFWLFILFQWKVKRVESFFFPFSENKKDKQNSEQAWTFLVSF